MDAFSVYMNNLSNDFDSLKNRSLGFQNRQHCFLRLIGRIDHGYMEGFLTRDQMSKYFERLIDEHAEMWAAPIKIPPDYPGYAELGNMSNVRFVSELMKLCWTEADLLNDQQLIAEQQKPAVSASSTQSTLSKAYVCPVKQSRSAISANTAEKSAKVENDQDNKLAEIIMAEVADGTSQEVVWHDIAGLEFVKKTIQEIVIWPMLRPDIFTGLRGPPRGLLLFGPPGTGKTLIGRCIACQSKSKFFSISASSLTSKWEGEGEKLVRTLFKLAREHSPSVIFMDEIDSLLTHRKEGENDASRRIKTEFLVQMHDGVKANDKNERVLMIGATNRPQEIDDAARRRFTRVTMTSVGCGHRGFKRLYVPLPNTEGRHQMLANALEKLKPHSLNDDNVRTIAEQTTGFSGADMTSLCQEAAMNPIRRLAAGNVDISLIRHDQVDPVGLDDFVKAYRVVKPSVGQGDLVAFEKWNSEFGTSLSVPQS